MNQRLLTSLTVLNLMLLAFLLAQMGSVQATSPQPSVLRGKGLEIVDDQGRLRASITLQRGDEDSVLLRLITPDGKPAVKVDASMGGTGILLMGRGQGTYARLGAKGVSSKLELINASGKPLTVAPASE
jgi:hypothetical protein